MKQRKGLTLLLAALTLVVGVGGVASAQEEGESASKETLENLRGRFTSIFGPVGLIRIPTAYTTPAKNGQVGMTISPDLRTVAANYGIIRSVDVGVTVADRSRNHVKGLFNAKVNIIPSNFDRFQLGIGFIDLFDALNQTFYAVGSVDVFTTTIQNQVYAMRAHGGFGSGLFRDKFIGGVELLLTRQFSLVGEYNGDNFAFGGRWTPGQNFGFQIGVQDENIFVNSTYNVRF
jgi:hypothetical protein